jgi:membrane protease YdiL (CAAX protease family)
LLEGASGPGSVSPDEQAWGLLLVLTLPWLGLAGWPLVATAVKGLGPVRELRLRARRRDVAFGVLGGLVALTLAIVVGIVTELLLDHPIESSVGVLAEDLGNASPWPIVVLALLTAFGAPVVEEIAFRGLLFGALEKRGTAPLWCVVVTGVLFALFHLEPIRLPLLLAIGLVLGVVRAVTGSTVASIVTHMTINVLGAIGILQLAFD